MKFLVKLSKESILCTELLIKDYKNILKSCYGEESEVDISIFIETLCEAFSNVSGKELSYFKKLSIFDFFCFLLDLRINSVGNICSVVLHQEDKKANLELRLDFIKEDLIQLSSDIMSTVMSDNININLDCPSIEKLLVAMKEREQEEYKKFIKEIVVTKQNEKIEKIILYQKETDLLINSISAKTLVELINSFESIIEKINNTNFLNRYRIKAQSVNFYPSLDTLLWFTKLIFTEPLDSLYDNIFLLSYKAHMNAEYVEKLVVGEYQYFVNCLKKATAPSKGSSATEYNIPTGHFDDGLLNT
jgi:hypothetical protein